MIFAMSIALLSFAAAQDAPQRVTLHCEGHLGYGDELLAVGHDLSFETTISFAEGHFIALSAPESNRVERLLYDAEVLLGSITITKTMPQDIVWTRATSRKGGVVGLFIGSGGDITSLTIHSAPAGSGERAFVLLSTASASAYQGFCH